MDVIWEYMLKESGSGKAVRGWNLPADYFVSLMFLIGRPFCECQAQAVRTVTVNNRLNMYGRLFCD